MELLIGDIVKLGGDRKKLKAKVFCGGSVLVTGNSGGANVSENNIRFAREYLAAEGIPLVSSDVGESDVPKVMIFTRDVRVLLKRIPRSAVADLQTRERAVLEKVRKDQEKKEAGDLTLF